MRVWLYDTLVASPELAAALQVGVEDMPNRVIPRESASNINLPKPFVAFGLGTNTNEGLSEDPEHEAHRQFFQLWIHDSGTSYLRIDAALEALKNLLRGNSHAPSKVSQVIWLENSSEFSNETFNTIFRYARFQAIISKGVPIS